MQMHEQIMVIDGQEQPISRTYQYRKVSVVFIESYYLIAGYTSSAEIVSLDKRLTDLTLVW